MQGNRFGPVRPHDAPYEKGVPVDLHLRPSRAAGDATPRRTRFTVRRGAAAVLACVLGVTLLSVGGSASALNAKRTGPLDNKGFPSYDVDVAGRGLQLCTDGTPLCQGVKAGDLVAPAETVASGVITQRVLLVQFFQEHLSQAVQCIISSGKQPECAAAADAGQAAQHVVIDVIASAA